MERLEYLFIDNFPSIDLIMWFLPISILFGLLSLKLCGYLKLEKGWRTGYSRKLFHFITYSTVGFIQSQLMLPYTFVFGGGISLVVLYALIKGEGNILYEALAREKDAPRQSLYILFPYLATLLGGLLTNYLFDPQTSMIAYFVTGFGDAIGEPIGVRFGKHKYKVPSVRGVVSYRSFEGSMAIVLASFVAILLGVGLLGISLNGVFLFKMAFIAFVVGIIEGLSPHGWDNFTTMVGSALLINFMINPIFI